MQTNKILIIIYLLLFVIGCKKNNPNAINTNTETSKTQLKETPSLNSDDTKDENKSLVISCGSGCSMTYIAKNISQNNTSIKVKFEVNMYIDELLTETYYETYIFIYNELNKIQKIEKEGNNQNILETLMPDAQYSFKDFSDNLIKGFKYNETSSDKNSLTKILNEKLMVGKNCTLPFNLKKWIDWQTSIDEGVKLDDGRYPSIQLEENERTIIYSNKQDTAKRYETTFSYVS